MQRFLRSDKWAKKFEDCYPQGNGSIGVMDNANPYSTKLVLNDEAFWSGRIEKKENKKFGKEGVLEIREALQNKDFVGAEKLVKDKLAGLDSESFIPLGFLTIDKGLGIPSKYQRTLDLERGVLSLEYTLNDKEYKEESFVSFPDQVYVKRFESKGKSIFKFRFSTTHPVTHDQKGDEWYIYGNAPAHIVHHDLPKRNPIVYDKENPGMTFVCGIKIETDAEVIYPLGDGLRVVNATYCNIFYTSGTGIRRPQKTNDEGKENVERAQWYSHEELKGDVSVLLEKASQKGYKECLNEHIKDYSELFNRVYFSINGVKESPKDIARSLKEKKDYDSLVVTLYDFNRYLIIASSREGSLLPSNLQGLWCDSPRPKWSSGYTMNINLQMNYWPVMSANLKEATHPFYSFMNQILKEGQKTARQVFGCEGFVLGHNSDGHYHASPVGGETAFSSSSYSLAMSTSGWLINQMFDMYSYTEDKKVLEEQILGVAEEGIKFYLDCLWKDKEGKYCIGPDISPENSYLYENRRHSVDNAPAITMAVIRELFGIYLKLGKDKGLQERIAKVLPALPKYKLTEDGKICEWSEDFNEGDPNHRHLSHLYGLYPGNEMCENQELLEGCKTTLEKRGDGGTGWSLAWKICLFARLQNGEEAYKYLKKQFNTVKAKAGEAGGSYKSLLSAHPPFQIDGNFGTLAGINEMLVQSHTKEILPLPAIPSCWKSGEVSGLRVRGNKAVYIKWENGEINKFEVKNLE